jgi:hypothetical protein
MTQAESILKQFIVFWCFCGVVTITALVGLLAGVATDPELWAPVGIFCGLSSLALMWALHRFGYPWSSGPLIYLVYLWVFHFPMLLLSSLNEAALDESPSWIRSWAQNRSWHDAGLFAVLSATAFALGAVLSFRRSAQTMTGNRGGFPWHDALLQRTGAIELFCGSGVILFAILTSGGTRLFGESYEALGDQLFSAGSFGIGMLILTQGLALTAIGVKPQKVKLVLACQAIFTGVMLLFGARSAALIPGLIMLVILNKRGIRIPRPAAIGGIVLLLWVIAIVGAARHEGVINNLSASSSATPVDALMELGGSLQTVSLSFQWIEAGDQFQLGGGYWLPFERMIGLIVPGVRTDLETDKRAMNMVLLSREHGLGGSVVAESYYNFGLWGALLFFLPVGYLVGYLDRASNPISTAWFVAIFYPLLMEVRNWFISVPAMILFALVPLIAAEMCRNRRAVNRRPQQLPEPARSF